MADKSGRTNGAADKDDPLCAPDPDGGWSTMIRSVPDAVIVPITEGYLVHDAGVFDASGAYVHEAVLWRGRPLLVPPAFPSDAPDLPGRWLWGGVLHGHFGHFLTESTGRLWALDAVREALDGIVFLAKRDLPQGTLALFHRTFFDLCGITLPIRIVSAPLRVERLEVPGQGFGIGPLISGTAPFRDFMKRRSASDVAPAGGENLYVSRARLGADLGGVVCESVLEDRLADCGYEIFHPQEHPLEVQIARYKAARRIVAPDGSALHLAAMVARPEQAVAVIKRRASNGSSGILLHLGAFMGHPPVVLDAITRNWVRSDRGAVDNYSYGELDLLVLSRALAEAGFVPKTTVWPMLTKVEVRAAMDKVAGASGGFTYLPVDRGAPVPGGLTRAERQAARAARRTRKAARAARQSAL